MSQKIYSPRPGTLPSMCIGFFENNPHEELTLACAYRNKQAHGTFKAAKINDTQARIWRIA